MIGSGTASRRRTVFVEGVAWPRSRRDGQAAILDPDVHPGAGSKFQDIKQRRGYREHDGAAELAEIGGMHPLLRRSPFVGAGGRPPAGQEDRLQRVDRALKARDPSIDGRDLIDDALICVCQPAEAGYDGHRACDPYGDDGDDDSDPFGSHDEHPQSV
ncbi:MAG: hypothetical protein OXC31_13000 [Spirochaetaceae bacterium]|nr:hypothetical protein [Spirochaetaceae bacterium]